MIKSENRTAARGGRLKGHGAMMGAEILWGVSAPLGKAIIAAGMSPLLLTGCRMWGAAILFWILSLFTPREHVPARDLGLMFFAALLGVVINQCCFVWGLGLTSPVNASIITTSLPILTMVLAAVVLGEPITRLKAGGVFLGAAGALALIAGSSSDSGGGSIAGDLLVICAQMSFTCYLVFFKKLIGRYSPVTLMKWLFTYAALCVLPFTCTEWADTDWSAAPGIVAWGTAAFVVGPTFLSYLLLPVGQKNLRPTVTAMYNYVQPVIATLVAVWAGLGRFTAVNAVAVVMIFTGVFLVTRSKARHDIGSQPASPQA
ncbi:MAG: DMT family transporter [Muribaculaceae bacterium]|nr:DMT family transporter [Muribaculaceae bacterium]